jgi:thiol-disulfide isomerase/thioredoxin
VLELLGGEKMKEPLKEKLRLAVFSFVCAMALLLALWNPLSPATLLEAVEPPPKPYNEQADARLDLVGARARANAAGRLLLIEYGGNWCPYCRGHAALMEKPEVQEVLSENYEVVWVDVGQFDKNLHLYEPIAGPLEAVPSTLIVDPASGKLLNEDDIRIPDKDPRENSADALAEWLGRYVRASVQGRGSQRQVVPSALPF